MTESEKTADASRESRRLDPNEDGRSIVTIHVNTEPTWRGGEQQTLYLLKGLERHSHSVLLIAQAGGAMAQRARDARIETVELRMRGEVDPLAVWRLSRLFRQRNADIVHCHTSHAHTLAVFASRLLGRRRPRVVLSRRVDFSIYRHSFLGLNGLKYRMVDQIVAISQRIKDVLVADGMAAESIIVVPSGIDPERFQNVEPLDLRSEFGLPPETVVAVNVAYFADHKGQRYLVEAAPKVLAKHPHACIILVGDGELRQPLMDRARELGISERVRFPGFRDDVPAILRGADIHVMPSHLEGLGTSVLDALCCGLPVVAARAGGIPEMVRHRENGLLVEPKNADALAEALIELFGDAELRRRLGQAGPATVANGFTADAMVEGNIEVYRRVLGTRRTAP